VSVFELLSEFNPHNYLFEGQKAGERYSEKSLENILRRALKKPTY